MALTQTEKKFVAWYQKTNNRKPLRGFNPDFYDDDKGYEIKLLSSSKTSKYIMISSNQFDDIAMFGKPTDIVCFASDSIEPSIVIPFSSIKERQEVYGDVRIRYIDTYPKIQIVTSEKGKKLLTAYCIKHGFKLSFAAEKVFEEKKNAYRTINELRQELKDVHTITSRLIDVAEGRVLTTEELRERLKMRTKE